MNIGSGRLALLFALLLGGCEFVGNEDNPTGTEVENEVVGKLFLAEGGPAVNAKVKIVPVGWSPLTSSDSGGAKIYSAVTGKDGAYRLKIQPGQYNVLGSAESLASFLDSVEVAKSTRTLPPDTLAGTHSLTGYVALQPNHLPSAATVEVLGTQYFANVNDAGEFRLQGLASGRYNIRVSTIPLLPYTPLYTSFRVGQGIPDTLPDTLRLSFSGVPVVTGMRVEYDTLTGKAKVSWKAVKYSLLSDYAVFRDEAGYARLSAEPLTRVTDTVIIDPVFPTLPTQEEALSMEGLTKRFEYRIKARSKSDVTGENFGFVALNAPSPATVRTFLDLHGPAADGMTVSPNDTARVLLDYRNAGRTNDSLFWLLDSTSSPIRMRSGLGRSGSDTLILSAPAQSGSISIRASMLDDAGSRWERSITLSIIADAPKTNAGKDTAASIGASLLLRGAATQRFGTIRKWEWDIGAKGRFQETSGPDTSITLPSTPDSAFRCVLRATDDDGGSGLDTISIVVSPSYLVGPQDLPMGFGLAKAGDHLYLMGGTVGTNRMGFADQVLSYDIVGKSFHVKKRMPASRFAAVSVEYNGKIYLAGGSTLPPGGSQYSLTDMLWSYDPPADSWSVLKPMNRKFSLASAVVLGDKMYVVGNPESNGSSLQEYDFATDTWVDKSPYPRTSQWILKAVALDGKIYLFTVPNGSGPTIQIYDPAKDEWTLGSQHPIAYINSAVVVNGKILVFGDRAPAGGRFGYVPSRSVSEYDPATNSLKPGFPMQVGRLEPQAIAAGSHVFIFQGECTAGLWDLSPRPEMCQVHEEYILP